MIIHVHTIMSYNGYYMFLSNKSGLIHCTRRFDVLTGSAGIASLHHSWLFMEGKSHLDGSGACGDLRGLMSLRLC